MEYYEDQLMRLRELAMFRIRKNFYDEQFISVIENRRYYALRDARDLIGSNFFYELYLDLSAAEREGFLEWEKKIPVTGREERDIKSIVAA